MNVSVVLEQLDEAGYRATTVTPVPLVAEAETRQQVLEGIREMLRDKLSQVEIIQVQVPSTPKPAVLGARSSERGPLGRTASTSSSPCRTIAAKLTRTRGAYEPLRLGYGPRLAAALRPRGGCRADAVRWRRELCDHNCNR